MELRKLSRLFTLIALWLLVGHSLGDPLDGASFQTGNHEKPDCHCTTQAPTTSSELPTPRQRVEYRVLEPMQWRNSMPGFLKLGEMLSNFEGPRRKRDLSSQNNNVYFVYSKKVENSTGDSNPELYSNSELGEASLHGQKQSVENIKINKFSGLPVKSDGNNFTNSSEILQVTEKTSFLPFHPVMTSTIRSINGFQQKMDTFAQDKFSKRQELTYYGPSGGFRLGAVSGDPLPPAWLTNFYDWLITFEVKHPFWAEVLKTMAVVSGVAALVICWVAMGVFFGVINLDEDDPSRSLEKRGTSDISEDNILLALTDDWLELLEQKIRKRKAWRRTHAHCCIQPQLDQVNCMLTKYQLVKIPKCPEGLSYDLKFSGHRKS